MLTLLPFACLSSFLYERQFYQRENAAGLYPCSAFYLANITLELLFNSINGAIFAAVTYYLIDYQAFLHAEGARMFLGYLGIVVLTNVMGNVSPVLRLVDYVFLEEIIASGLPGIILEFSVHHTDD